MGLHSYTIILYLLAVLFSASDVTTGTGAFAVAFYFTNQYYVISVLSVLCNNIGNGD